MTHWCCVLSHADNNNCSEFVYAFPCPVQKTLFHSEFMYVLPMSYAETLFHSEFMYALAMSCAEDTILQLSSPALGSYIFFLALCSLSLGKRDMDIPFRAEHCHHCQPFDYWISELTIAIPCKRSSFNEGWKQCLSVGINIGILQELWHHVPLLKQ